MFGTRHEKIIITIAAYIIGFTTAFIAFGVGKTVVQESGTYTQMNSSDTSFESNASVLFSNDGLYIRTENKDQLLSANKTQLSANVISGAETSGIYYAIVDAELSRDEKFVYFCEQLSEDVDKCDPFIYDVDRDVLVRVTTPEGEYHSDVAMHISSWTQDNLLTLDSYISAHSESPWELIPQ